MNDVAVAGSVERGVAPSPNVEDLYLARAGREPDVGKVDGGLYHGGGGLGVVDEQNRHSAVRLRLRPAIGATATEFVEAKGGRSKAQRISIRCHASGALRCARVGVGWFTAAAVLLVKLVNARHTAGELQYLHLNTAAAATAAAAAPTPGRRRSALHVKAAGAVVLVVAL